jgi:hypothetical protein
VRIRWNNIFGLLFLVMLIYLFIMVGPALRRFFESIGSAYYYEVDPFHHLVMLGLLCITVVAVCKIIFNRRR